MEAFCFEQKSMKGLYYGNKINLKLLIYECSSICYRFCMFFLFGYVLKFDRKLGKICDRTSLAGIARHHNGRRVI